ncbi:Protein-L-isoaspartate O-methyltransferase domain-containing protein 1 [Trichoplax sp. H2]|nr:Protein-L-isoaspartate O-methyltransferase domain-containing protein 1 [Trichoplax sp. H2]|eukprot:RDD46215.1 Protein-L-isoaspartate O-methyltransferase domain-containing protein 1 [Trichoplax sp. H2]
MGGVVSSGEDNDELIDNLKKVDYLRTPSVEKAFRSVDRGHYYLEEYQENAYCDMAWKQGNLHISAACIYAEVAERLMIQPGQSFLNIGSGTGYLSTVIGNLLGPFGVNHGIELHLDVVEYAKSKLKEYLIMYCNDEDIIDFCNPIFVHGNCFRINPSARRYDRIYVGAACPEESYDFFKQLLNINGYLIMPFNDKLIRVRRLDENNWECEEMLDVAFLPLIPASANDNDLPHIQMPACKPHSLRSLCRRTIRKALGKNILNKIKELDLPPTLKNYLCYNRNTRKDRIRTISGGSDLDRNESNGNDQLVK